MKHETCKPAGLLQPLSIPNRPWSAVSMDFINGLPMSQRLDTTKVAALFAQNILKLHGMPTSIVSDRDSIFTAKFWAKLFKLQGVQLAMSSTYHP